MVNLKCNKAHITFSNKEHLLDLWTYYYAHIYEFSRAKEVLRKSSTNLGIKTKTYRNLKITYFWSLHQNVNDLIKDKIPKHQSLTPIE